MFQDCKPKILNPYPDKRPEFGSLGHALGNVGSRSGSKMLGRFSS